MYTICAKRMLLQAALLSQAAVHMKITWVDILYALATGTRHPLDLCENSVRIVVPTSQSGHASQNLFFVVQYRGRWQCSLMSCPEDDVTHLQLHTPKLLKEGHPRRADDLGPRRRSQGCAWGFHRRERRWLLYEDLIWQTLVPLLCLLDHSANDLHPRLSALVQPEIRASHMPVWRPPGT